MWGLSQKCFRDLSFGFIARYLILVSIALFLLYTTTNYSFIDDKEDQMDEKNSSRRETQFLPSKIHPNIGPGPCPVLGNTIPPPVSKRNRFLLVAGTNTYVYSAYMDDKRIRVITLRMINETNGFVCQLWYRNVANQVTLDIREATVKDIPRTHNPVHTACYIFCDLSHRDPASLPFAVSITKEVCERPTYLLPVQDIPKSLTSEFLVCVPPIHHGMNDYKFLVESIEFKRLLGIQRFVFYLYDVGQDLLKILQYYKSQGLVDLIDWPLPLRSEGEDPEVFYYAQKAAISDCLYRYRHLSKYIVFQDIDEFIVPQGNLTNLSQLVEHRRRKENLPFLQIRNVFFPSTTHSHSIRVENSEKLPVVLRQNVREKLPFPYAKKAKCIVDPRRVESMGIHQVLEGNTPMDKVPVKDALMYHYRFRSERWRPETGVVDKTVEKKYGLMLVARLKQAWKKIKESSVLTV